MANKNITQLVTQSGTADPTSLFYTVTGGNTDMSLPLTVLFNNPTFTGTPTVPGYLTTALAASTYLTQTNAASTYAPLASPTFTGTVVIPTVTLSGGTINNTSIGATTKSTGAFTTLSATGQFTSTVSTGTAPFVISSTTNVANLNASTLGGATFASPGPVGSTTPSTGAFTTLSASSTVSGTGFSTYLASPPAIGGTAANTGKFTTLQSTSTFTPSTTSGIVGTTLADNANAGSVGEYVTGTGGLVSISTATPFNATSISLTAGDWEVSGIVTFVPAGTTTVQAVQAGISLVSATYGSANTGSFQAMAAAFNTGSTQAYASPTVRINVSTTTTVYLVGALAFGVSTAQGEGFIRARRVR